MNKERLEEIKQYLVLLQNAIDVDEEMKEYIFKDLKVEWLIEQAEKQVIKQVTEKAPGGGSCPSCNVRLIGKANYCGKCGQKVGWKIYE